MVGAREARAAGGRAAPDGARAAKHAGDLDGSSRAKEDGPHKRGGARS